MREYRIMVGGLYHFDCLKKSELAEVIDALSDRLYHGKLRLQYREVAAELGTPWHVCHEDMLMWTRPDYEGRQGRIYVTGNGDICFGRKQAIEAILAQGLFTREESAAYVDAIR